MASRDLGFHQSGVKGNMAFANSPDVSGAVHRQLLQAHILLLGMAPTDGTYREDQEKALELCKEAYQFAERHDRYDLRAKADGSKGDVFRSLRMWEKARMCYVWSASARRGAARLVEKVNSEIKREKQEKRERELAEEAAEASAAVAAAVAATDAAAGELTEEFDHLIPNDLGLYEQPKRSSRKPRRMRAYSNLSSGIDDSPAQPSAA